MRRRLGADTELTEKRIAFLTKIWLWKITPLSLLLLWIRTIKTVANSTKLDEITKYHTVLALQLQWLDVVSVWTWNYHTTYLNHDGLPIYLYDDDRSRNTRQRSQNDNIKRTSRTTLYLNTTLHGMLGPCRTQQMQSTKCHPRRDRFPSLIFPDRILHIYLEVPGLLKLKRHQIISCFSATGCTAHGQSVYGKMHLNRWYIRKDHPQMISLTAPFDRSFLSLFRFLLRLLSHCFIAFSRDVWYYFLYWVFPSFQFTCFPVPYLFSPTTTPYLHFKLLTEWLLTETTLWLLNTEPLYRKLLLTAQTYAFKSRHFPT